MKLEIDICLNPHGSSKNELIIGSAYLAGNLADNRQELTFGDHNLEGGVRILLNAKKRIEALLDEINREQAAIINAD